MMLLKRIILKMVLFFKRYVYKYGGPNGREVWGVGLRSLACWDYGFEFQPGCMDVCLFWVFFVLSVRGLCDELITGTEESYRLWCVVVCDLETSRMRRPWPTGRGEGGCCRKTKLVCWDCEFESHPGHRCLSVVSFLCVVS